MANLEQPFGLHETVLRVRAQRMELLASNMANADTPGYKARDLEFHTVLAAYRDDAPSGTVLRTTRARHLSGNEARLPIGEPLYRVPLQPSIDGNTVDPQIEKAKFMESALSYQATLNFIDGRIKSLRKAFKGD